MSKWQNALDQALQAAERGFPVFPLSINKVPAIRSPHQQGHRCRGECGQPGHGVYDATTDPNQLRALFDGARGAAGYGIACGTDRMPLIGLDLDRKNGVDGVTELNRIAGELRITIPRTVTVCTPSGGFHLWFTAPARVTVPNSVSKMGPGIDIRGTAGYLVGPGSHGRAGAYFIHPDLGAPVVHPIPEQLLRLLLPAPVQPARRFVPAQGHGGAVLQGLVRVVAESSEGTRNDRLYWAAAKAWAHVRDGHIAAGEVVAELVRAAVGVGLGEGEAQRTVASAQKGAGA